MSTLISSNEIITFGKYKSRNIKDIIIENPSYCQWLLERPSYLNEDQIKLINASIKDDDIYMTFGKYKNKPLKWIFENDKKYIHFLMNNEYVKNKMSNLIDHLKKF